MTERTREWAERVGREAVALGMPHDHRLGCLHLATSAPHAAYGKRWNDDAPDLRDRLTELACIAWVEDVAREVYKYEKQVQVSLGPAGVFDVCIIDLHYQRETVAERAPTLAEACIAAVRAMKGGE